MYNLDIKSQLPALGEYFKSGKTRTYEARVGYLRTLRSSIIKYENEIFEALFKDLKKSKEESFITETGMVVAEINKAIGKLSKWMKPTRVATNLLNLPSKSFIIKEPLGVVLIISPWNYPFQLLLNPLVGAIAAGNCAVLKPSEFCPSVNQIIRKIIGESFDDRHIMIVEGEGAQIIPAMIRSFRFDHIFYTGSTEVGRSIYQLAAERLTPVTLELGGKSPCVVESDADIKIAAKRIAITKFSNAGQMCVAPDYVLIHHSIRRDFTEQLTKTIKDFFGDDPRQNYNYGKIINKKQFDRLQGLLSNTIIEYGGEHDRESDYLGPTIVSDIDLSHPLMKEEIFGPILPILSFNDRNEALSIIERQHTPLAFYVFSSSRRTAEDWISSVPFGGGCINNASWHLTNPNLPFGGKGLSGMGRYHGKHSFDTFSHFKSIMKTPTWFDPAVKYPPFRGKLKLFRWVLR